ncbi:heterochromatin protein 1-binding protein 3 isoform X1 [Gambusia affinis]|uniref:heterochromatin protein 1-binding protein 3 isoform X1 n=1 Tax=Gambusia affinis TaxID=33528 RepID=UPI001CDD3AE2|nr:heterochromatin protein 1-binding protein 3 isoform X1 [Gambusia affinis]XP_043976884.1 heterochromatin protein 1-binding protein 3 isoform X1 [Gambusia affinis]
MPIRRAAATPTQEKAPSAAAEKEQEASSEESPPADKEQAASSAAPAEGEASGDGETEGKSEKAEDGPLETKEEPGDGKEHNVKCQDCAAGQCSTHCYVLLLRMKDGVKHKKSKSKKVKRTIPAWASVTTHKKIPVSNFAGTQNKVENVLVEAIGSSNERSGMSFQSVMKYMLKKYPGMEFHKKKTLIKKSMKKHLEKGTIKQLKGKGLSGTFAIGKAPPQSKKGVPKLESLGDALPLIITRLCEPKEASYNLIKKYLEQHFPSLNIENRPDQLKTALVRAVEKGHLEQITGTGARGTFQLKRAAKESQLKGSTLEDAITVAITAMNEPKTCSTTSLRKYLVDSNKDVKENLLVANLRRTLTKCKVLGWMEQITGHGFTGTYQLSFPFYPSPTTLYPEKFKDVPKKTVKRKRLTDSSDEEDEEEEEESEEEESEDEAPVRKRKPIKRPPPKARRPPPTKKPRSVSKPKAAGKGRALAKKSPAKKTVRSGRNPSKKETVSTPKATPVKKGAPSRKSKTPAVKKLIKKGSRKPPSRESSPDEPKVEKATTKSGSRRIKNEESYPEESKVLKETTKSGSKRPKVEESLPRKEPTPKKQAARGGSKKKAQPSPPEKADLRKNPKSSKQSTRKSKRGRY